MSIGVNFWVKKQAIRVIIYIMVITSISILGNLKYNEFSNSKVNRLMAVNPCQWHMFKNKNFFATNMITTFDKIKNVTSNPMKQKGKKAFLTFDDGPSGNITPKILEILKEKKIKATFFLVGLNIKTYPNLVKREYEEGHSIGNHSYTHEYKKIYANMNSFLNEVNSTDSAIKSVLGDKYIKKIFRFPGGAFDRYGDYKKALKAEGYQFYDWNCLNGDAEGLNVPKEKLINRIKNTVGNQEKIIILMHDMETKKTTYEALPEIIDYLTNQGYEFATL